VNDDHASLANVIAAVLQLIPMVIGPMNCGGTPTAREYDAWTEEFFLV
jgi:hypothetical protein